MIKYYFCTNGVDVQGPLDESILNKMYIDGTIPSNTPVCMEGLQEWKPINEVFVAKVNKPQVGGAKANRPQARTKNNQIKCPNCSKLINNKSATVCPHCKEIYFSKNKNTNSLLNAVWTVVVFFVIYYSISSCSSCMNEKTELEEAMEAAEKAMEYYQSK